MEVRKMINKTMEVQLKVDYVNKSCITLAFEVLLLFCQNVLSACVPQL